MQAARIFALGEALRVDEVPEPAGGPGDVLFDVEACAATSTMKSVVSGAHAVVTAPLPAILGPYATGTVRESGERVLVAPVVGCGRCRACLRGRPSCCPGRAMIGFFGYGRETRELLGRYPGGFAETAVVPAANVVKLPDEVSFRAAPHLGYVATSYAALVAGELEAGDRVVVVGATGALGSAAVQFAAAMGAERVLAVGRRREALARVARAAPGVVTTLALTDETRPGDMAAWIREETRGEGADILIDCQGLFAGSSARTAEAMSAIGNGGRVVFLGGVGQDVAVSYLGLLRSQIKILGSWMSTPSQVTEVLAMAAKGHFDAELVPTRSYALKDVNEAIADAAKSPGPVVVCPRGSREI